jgi:serine/threonine-protein kinase
VPPGGDASHPIVLPLPSELGPDDVYIPAGWFWSGGEGQAPGALPRHRAWEDAFVMRRFPVTNREYLRFLDDLVAQGRETEALRHAPRERPGSVGMDGALIYGFEGGRFFIQPDTDGDVWRQEDPVLMVAWSGAQAFAGLVNGGWIGWQHAHGQIRLAGQGDQKGLKGQIGLLIAKCLSQRLGKPCLAIGIGLAAHPGLDQVRR